MHFLFHHPRKSFFSSLSSNTPTIKSRHFPRFRENTGSLQTNKSSFFRMIHCMDSMQSVFDWIFRHTFISYTPNIPYAKIKNKGSNCGSFILQTTVSKNLIIRPQPHPFPKPLLFLLNILGDLFETTFAESLKFHIVIQG